MQSSQSLKHCERLRNLSSIRRLFESGHRGFVYPLRYQWIEDSVVLDEESDKNSTSAEVLFSVPKKFHKRANKRNILRRRVKESYRLNKHIILDCKEQPSQHKMIDIALIYSTKECHSYKTINHAVRKILEQIAQSR